MGRIKVVVIGHGLAATYFLVGLERLKRNEIPDYGIPLRNWLPYSYEDIDVVATYDVDDDKVGKTAYDVARKVFGPNVPGSLKEINIYRGVHLGSLRGLPYRARGREEREGVRKAMESIMDEWRSFGAEVFLNVMTTEPAEPIGDAEEIARRAEEGGLTASQTYAYMVAIYSSKARKAVFVNEIPTPLASDEGFVKLYEQSNAILLGDDAATGATPLTADLLEHMYQRNRRVLDVVQFNIGGNADFLALTEPERNIMKKRTKSSMVSDILGYEAPSYIRPTGYLEPLGDRKLVAMQIEYLSFNNYVDEIYVVARINDKPAIAGLMVDLARLGKVLIDRGVRGTAWEVNAFYMKRPGPPGRPAIAKSLAFLRLLQWLGIEDPRGKA
ncbi:MAG: myo-inositol-1-phosphate synthase [Desulfurococcaceae archaeon]